ncbi:hypothetical protein MNEG_1033 [Monoraphidium neglectum]|uniref:MYND-type domain-containing protein n=1 Tax=Monoraphidium neglectum TaxID=145388 RepID=A0A0D2LKI9_9CHLO|nr:hypothetical protein MNEG_1033 [Monoraphidium neglectum]KIZ06924.1 hypothetical protein MNEG_1033 [Monoraphidium neglectum]|eukprot:XP_013905943.1 hypothetical protein MNEG_1033 [Monoraphidium neglectum]
MEFREYAWAQQLYRQRLIYGPAAEATEKSYPKYPAAALRELIRQSKHPHNLEPLLLTLARPANDDTRKRFAELAGELVLVERALSDDVVCEDLQVVVGGRVEKAPDGMLYPDKHSQVPYEVWVRVEMLQTLTIMLNEGAVRSLTPGMQSKLVNDLLARVADSERHALVRGYALRAAHAAVVAFNAVRPEVLRPGGAQSEGGAAAAGPFVRAAVAALRLAAGDAADDTNGGAGGGPEAAAVAAAGPINPYVADPFERLKLLSTACQALYLAVTGPDAAPTLFGAASRQLRDTQQPPAVLALAAAEAPFVVAFGGALLQLLACAGSGGDAGPAAWPGEAAIAELLGAPEGGVVHQVAGALKAGAADADAPAIVGLPSFAALAAAAFGRRCDQCATREAPGAAHKRCSACARAFYCSEKCQKAAWSGGHKAACKQMQLAAASAKSP